MKTTFKKLTTLFLSLIMILTIFMGVSAHPTTTSVDGIIVNVSNSVSDSSYNTFISWVRNMPSYLKNNIEVINVVDNIQDYNITAGVSAAGLTDGRIIYIKASNLTSRKGTLYHEAGHVLDNVYGYSYTDYWQKIRKAEWANAGYYSTQLESFAEAISHYHVDGLTKSQSKKAIQNIINYGFIEGKGAYSSMNRTIYTNNIGLFMYTGASDTTDLVCIIPIGKTATAIGVNSNKTWYRVNYNGKVGFVHKDRISFTRDTSFPFTKTLFVNNNSYEIQCKSGTYKEVAEFIKSLGYSSFTLKNNWGSTVYSYYNVTDDKACYATDLSTSVIKTFTVNGKAYSVACESGTYQEVFDFVKNLGYTSFTLKNAWGSQVYGWYKTSESEKCSVSNLATVITKSLLFKHAVNQRIECPSGTYKEVFDWLDNAGYKNYTLRDNYGTVVYRWYKVTDSGACSIE